MGLYDFGFYDLLERNAVCFRSKPAWFEVDDQRSLTFAEYKGKVDQVACGLQGAGIKKGDRIGAYGKNSLEYFILYGAAIIRLVTQEDHEIIVIEGVKDSIAIGVVDHVTRVSAVSGHVHAELRALTLAMVNALMLRVGTTDGP